MAHVLDQALLIDDDGTVRALARRRLEALGYEVHEAADGVAGLSLLEAGLRASVILVDLFMPRLDAVGFRRKQLTVPALAAIPTVVMTSTDLAGIVAGSIGLSLLKKPFTPEALDEAIKAAEQLCPGSAHRISWL